MTQTKENAGVIVAGVLASAAAIVGLILWGRSRKLDQMRQDDPTAPIPAATQVGMWPDLKVGAIVSVAPERAPMIPSPFSAFPEVPGVVDFLLTDRELVSVLFGVKGISSASVTIPRTAIVRMISAPLPVLQA
jgi:hypothetical protein